MTELNPHFNHNWRKRKRRVKSLAKKLIPNVTYVMGCRGHPGLVVEKTYHPDSHKAWELFGSDVEIKSLIDGNVESCSIYHCVPEVITREYAERRAAYSKTHHALDVSVEFDGWDAEEIRRDYWDAWIADGQVWYVLNDHEDTVMRSAQVMSEQDANKEIDRLNRINPAFNPRMVDFRTYPAAPTLLGI